MYPISSSDAHTEFNTILIIPKSDLGSVTV